MAKIDRLGWAGGISLYAYGLKIGIRVNKPHVLEQVEARLPPGWEPGCGHFVDALYSLKVGGAGPRKNVRNYTLLYFGLQQLARTMDLSEALDALERHLQMYVAEFATNRVFIHAGVVGWKGQAIVLPGRSLSGKTTLVTALLRAGATYYSDEYAVLDGRGYVHPYARRLSVRRPENLRFERRDPEDFGSTAGTQPLPLGLVAAAKYRPDTMWEPRMLTPGKAVMELLNNAVAAQRSPEMVLTTLQKAVRDSVNLKGLRGDADDTARALLRAVEQSERYRPGWTYAVSA